MQSASDIVVRQAPARGIKHALTQWIGRRIGLRDHGFWKAWLSSDGVGGMRVGVDNTLQLSAAWACVRLVSETVATLPLNLYRKTGDSRVVAADHPLHRLLHGRPNADQTSVEFWQCYMASLMLWGNAYVEVSRNAVGDVVALTFLQPQLVSLVKTAAGSTEWHYLDPETGEDREISPTAMWHTKAFSLGGRFGLSPIGYGAKVLGAAMATDDAAARLFKGQMRSTGIVTVDTALNEKKRDEIRAHVRKVSAEGGVFVLEKGVGYEALSMNPEDAELLASRSWGVEEVCRWFGVPPFMVGHSEKSTSWGTGIEQQQIGFVQYVLRTWVRRIEASATETLLSPVERRTLHAEYVLEGLLRGDSTTRAAFYSQMTQNGIMSRDECRRLENLPAVGGNAAVLTVQTNLSPIDQLGATDDGTQARDALKHWLEAGRGKQG